MGGANPGYSRHNTMFRVPDLTDTMKPVRFAILSSTRPRMIAAALSVLAVWVTVFPTALPVHAQQESRPFAFHESDRVLFLGDTFFERESAYGHIETHLTRHHTEKSLRFRNLAWAADTPLGQSRASFDWNQSSDKWLARVREQIDLVKPTVAVLSYAMTASFAGPEGVAGYVSQMKQLMDAVTQVSGQPVRFVLLGPIPCEQVDGLSVEQVTHVSTNLQLYSEATRQLAQEQQAAFIDLARAFSEARPGGGTWTDNGIHLNEAGYRMIAGEIGKAFASNRTELPDDTAYDLLRRAIVKKNELFFHRWRPANWTYLFGFRKHEQGQNAGEIPKFDPLIEEWEARILKLIASEQATAASTREMARMLETSGQEESGTLPARTQNLPVFDTDDRFEVTLWAENPLLHKPIQINWDARGRLWVASSELYPQIQPGQPALDTVVVLEDTDGDGRADSSRVFGGGLMIPTGVLPDNLGGCYVADSHQLLHLSDTTGDGKADTSRIVMTSFGTEDTHHNLHTLRWGFDGRMYMNQSIYTHSHIETPHGIVRLNSGGIWRFDPKRHHMEVFTRGGCNPWGHHWDLWGNQFFTDGAGFKGVYHAMEGATYFTYADMRREAESITPGSWPKFCSLEVVHSPIFPTDWQRTALTCDFRAHRIVRFRLEPEGSTFRGREMPDLLRSGEVSFRPIDLRMGPDGALYIADWSNPIIQHGEVDFRDPRRDKEHGRIWRVALKDKAPLPREDLTTLDTPVLLEYTLHENGWHQEQARRVLATRTADAVLPAARAWAGSSSHPRAPLEMAWLHRAFNVPVPNLDTLLASDDARIRTAAVQHLLNR